DSNPNEAFFSHQPLPYTPIQDTISNPTQANCDADTPDLDKYPFRSSTLQYALSTRSSVVPPSNEQSLSPVQLQPVEITSQPPEPNQHTPVSDGTDPEVQPLDVSRTPTQDPKDFPTTAARRA